MTDLDKIKKAVKAASRADRAVAIEASRVFTRNRLFRAHVGWGDQEEILTFRATGEGRHEGPAEVSIGVDLNYNWRRKTYPKSWLRPNRQTIKRTIPLHNVVRIFPRGEK